jgi:hypothetical protein
MDPKAMDPQGFEVMDQRNIQYHYTGAYDETDPSTFGGYLAAYVLMTLNTSATGSQAISVMVLNKMNANFNVAQPMPLSIDSGPSSFGAYEDILAPHVVFHVPQDHKACKFLYADPTALVVGRPGLVMTNLNGVATRPYQAFHTPLFIRDTANGLIRSPWRDELASPGYPSVTLRATSQAFGPSDSVRWRILSTSGTGGTSDPRTDMAYRVALGVNLDIADTGTIYAPSFDLLTYATELITPSSNETIIYFQSQWDFEHQEPDDTFSCQSDHMYRTIQRLARANTWTPTDALLFTLVHTPTDLPVTFVKLYFEGFLTMGNVTTVTTFRLADYHLSFFGLTTRTGIIPSSTAEMRRNAFTLGSVARAQALEGQVRKLTTRLARARVDSSDDEANTDHLPGPSSDGASFVVRQAVKLQK